MRETEGGGKNDDPEIFSQRVIVLYNESTGILLEPSVILNRFKLDR